ncbi:MAG: Gfo/Idh/MocA family oxidoreductase [Phycisphaerales bacterium]
MMSKMTRRDVIKAGALGVGALVTPAFASRLARVGSDRIGVGLIGCGGRGTGAAWNALEADPSVNIVALADVFQDRLDGALGHLNGEASWNGRIDVPAERRFVGFEAYEKLLALPEVDYVCIATPPHFRPIHFEEAVRRGKHVFMEKPVAVDATGIRRVIAAAKKADHAGLSVVAGTQRRHERCYLELMDRVHSGQLGELVGASCYWNQGGLWVHERQPDESDMEYQIRNWLYFCWLSGDHICEQHIHNLDVINWAMGSTPLRAMGMGGRQVRTGPEYGNIFDHFSIEYEYPGGVRVQSMCRQIDGCAGRVDERLAGTRGSAIAWPGRSQIWGENAWEFKGDNPNPYMVEHKDLIASIRGECTRLNEGVRVAESALTAIMGRMSAYTGQEVTWEQAMGSKLDLAPAAYEFGAVEVDPVPTPGRTPLV